MTAEYKCPWCGMEHKNPKDLESHAKDHYITCIEGFDSKKLAVVTV